MERTGKKQRKTVTKVWFDLCRRIFPLLHKFFYFHCSMSSIFACYFFLLWWHSFHFQLFSFFRLLCGEIVSQRNMATTLTETSIRKEKTFLIFSLFSRRKAKVQRNRTKEHKIKRTASNTKRKKKCAKKEKSSITVKMPWTKWRKKKNCEMWNRQNGGPALVEMQIK